MSRVSPIRAEYRGGPDDPHIVLRRGQLFEIKVRTSEAITLANQIVDLAAASDALIQRASEKRLGDDSKAMVAFVHGRSLDGLSTSAAEVSEHMGWMDAEGKKKVRTYLARLAEGGHVYRAARGVYEAPTETPVVSEAAGYGR